MESIVELYKKISLEILEILKNEEVDNYKLDIFFNKRQTLIENLDKEYKINDFRKIYRLTLHTIDEEIKNLLEVKISHTKKELIIYRKNQKVNFAYANINKSNLNIFSKKV